MSRWIEIADEWLRTDYQGVLDSTTELCDLMNGEGSDKGNGHHNYSKIYHAMFKDIRNVEFCMFELGMGTNNIYIKSNMGINGKPGASLRAWSHYFSKARIFGADVDPAIVNGPHDNDRIKTHWVDQTSAMAIKSLWEKFNMVFDIIIDDGLHEVSGNMSFLENSHHKLSRDGVFIIEDILPQDIAEFCTRLNLFCAKHNFEYRLLDIPKCVNKIDNKIIILARK